VQLHRGFDPDDVRSLRAGLGAKCKLMQVISCAVGDLDSQKLKRDLQATLAEPELWGILLDASLKGASGGTGQSFDWEKVRAVLDEVWPERLREHGPKLILAGGLKPENVQAAIRMLQPYGVDVVSGVERVPGSKDEARVRAFVEAARGS
jgi:phosphoribosylanthranilate isomerase